MSCSERAAAPVGTAARLFPPGGYERMDVQAGTAPPPVMRSPARWLAVLRIAVGLWFAKAVFTKLTVTLAWGFLPVPTGSDRWQHVMPILEIGRASCREGVEWWATG